MQDQEPNLAVHRGEIMQLVIKVPIESGGAFPETRFCVRMEPSPFVAACDKKSTETAPFFLRSRAASVRLLSAPVSFSTRSSPPIKTSVSIQQRESNVPSGLRRSATCRKAGTVPVVPISFGCVVHKSSGSITVSRYGTVFFKAATFGLFALRARGRRRGARAWTRGFVARLISGRMGR